MSIGSRLRQLRKANNLSGDKFGELCGVTKGMVSQWESDGVTPPTDRLIELHKHLDFSFDWLLNGKDDEVTTYTTTDPALIEILKALEPRAEYIKESALQNVINTCKLADQASEPDNPRLIGHRLPPTGARHDRRSDWVTGGPEADGKKKSGGDE